MNPQHDVFQFLSSIHPSLNEKYFGNTPPHWIGAAILISLTYIAFQIFRKIIARKFIDLASKFSSMGSRIASAVLKAISNRLLLVTSFCIGIQVLTLGANTALLFERIGLVAILLQVGFMAVAGFGEWLNERSRLTAGTTLENLGVLNFMLRLIVWSLLILVGLDNFGINITTLIAGLGVGGIAIALATQNILGDIFASMTIVLDKPFVVGDYIVVGEFMGNIEQIGLKTTRIRSLSGEQISFSNNDLVNSRIRNYKRMNERRILFNVGVIYETRPELLRKIPELIRSIISPTPQTRFDRVYFKQFGAYSLDFEIVYYVLAPDFLTATKIQQEINFKIFEEFQKSGIEFAYPTALHLNKALQAEEKPNLSPRNTI